MQSLGGHPRNKSFSQGTEHLVINLNGINPLTCERLQLKRQNLSETMIFFWTSFKALLMSLVRGTDHEKLACSFAAMSYEHLDNFVKWSDEVVGYRRHKAFQICPIKTHILYTSLSVFASTTSSVISYNAQETFPRCGLLILLPSYNTMVNVCNNERGYWCWMTSILYMNRIHVSEHPPYQRQCEFPCLFFFLLQARNMHRRSFAKNRAAEMKTAVNVTQTLSACQNHSFLRSYWRKQIKML